MLSTEMPMYLYHSYELPHRGDGALFHYTKFGSLLDILNDLTLQPSCFKTLNDLNEVGIHNLNMNENFIVMYDAEKYINEHCHIISFSQNYDEEGFTQEGTNHPAMWGHYADNADGVCIVIDKDTFIKKNETILSKHFYKFEDVEYSYFNSPDDNQVEYDAKTPQEFIEKNWRSLFFLKHKDWENEDEHRLFIMDYDGKFSIDGCIKYIVLGKRLFEDHSRIKQILDMVVNPKSAIYHKFVPHSFAHICTNTSGYLTFVAAFKIMSVIRENISNSLYSNYEKWLCQECGYEINRTGSPIAVSQIQSGE